MSARTFNKTRNRIYEKKGISFIQCYMVQPLKLKQYIYVYQVYKILFSGKQLFKVWTKFKIKMLEL